MPTLNLAIGQMDLESDPTGKKDTVTALLYNGFRVGASIHMWPTLAELCDLGTGAPVYVWQSLLHGALFAVSAGRLFRVAGGLATEIIGAALSPFVPPTFTQDAHNVFVAADSPIFRISGDFASAIPGGQAPLHVRSLAFVAGFLIADGQDPAGGGLPGDFGYSDTQGDDGIPTYAVWAYENNASKPDALQRLVATPDEHLYAIGAESVDVSYISGSVDNPFAPNKGAAQPFGTPAPASVAYDDQSIYFVAVIGGNRQIVRLIGGREPQIIGFPVGVPIQDVADISTAQGYLLGYRGQTFYVVSFPDAGVVIEDQRHDSLTLAFSIRAQEFCILGNWMPEKTQFDAYTGVSFAYDQTTRFVGGKDGKIYTFAEEERTAEQILEHKWRNDGRLEWSIPRQISLGDLGERRNPVKSRNCGRYYRRQDELTVSVGNQRFLLRTGWRSWGKISQIKSNLWYAYDLKRGENGVVLNGIEEEVEVVK